MIDNTQGAILFYGFGGDDVKWKEIKTRNSVMTVQWSCSLFENNEVQISKLNMWCIFGCTRVKNRLVGAGGVLQFSRIHPYWILLPFGSPWWFHKDGVCFTMECDPRCSLHCKTYRINKTSITQYRKRASFCFYPMGSTGQQLQKNHARNKTLATKNPWITGGVL